MIGWNTKLADDISQRLQSGDLDEDLESLSRQFAHRLATKDIPTCPECGEPLESIHQHPGSVKETEIVVMTESVFRRSRGG